VHSQFFPRQLILYDKVMALLESNGNAINRESDANNDQSDEVYRQTSYNDFTEFIQQSINNENSGKTSQTVLGSNLNLPRYLR
ncbi:unnamed protein product, partial [Rotaria magnacalcarata]